MIAKRILVVCSFVSCCVVSGSLLADDYFQGYYPNNVYLRAGGAITYMEVRNMSLSPENASYLKKDKASATGATVFGAVGFQIKQIPLSFDLEYTYRPKLNYDVSPVIKEVSDEETMNSSLQNDTFMLNGYYNIHLGGGDEYLVPFLTAGMGVARNKVEMTATQIASPNTAYNVSKTKNNFAWQAGLGLDIKLTNNILIDLSGRYIDLGQAQWGPWGDANRQITSKSIFAVEGLVGIKIFFGNQKKPEIPHLMND